MITVRMAHSAMTSRQPFKRRANLMLLTATALSSNLSSSNAFVGQCNNYPSRPFAIVNSAAPPIHRPVEPRRSNSVRLFASGSSGDGILSKVTGAAKSILPKKWFQSEQERQQDEQREILQKEVTGSLKAIFKDAPLPIRALGSVIAPLMSNALSGLAEGMAEQQKQATDELSRARSLIAVDSKAIRFLGDDIQTGAPFSQASSSSNINGQVSTRVELGFPVAGAKASATARLTSVNGEIKILELQLPEGIVKINTSTSRVSSSNKRMGGGTRSGNDQIIEAEIVEKNVRP